MVDLAQGFAFGSKAETLSGLRGRLSESVVPNFRHYSLSYWRTQEDRALASIADLVTDGGCVIVRSSAQGEDGEVFAQAGAFLSVPHVDPRDPVAVRQAVNDVFESYANGMNGDAENPDDQVLVQRMVENVSMSGVVFTQVLSTGAPYYVINYDDETGSTDSVTAGTGHANRTTYIYRDHWAEAESPRFRKLISAIREIESLTEDGCLDIEFALDSDLKVHIFQVRRITTQPNWSRGLSVRIGDALERLRTSVGPMLLEAPGTGRKPTVLGKMPDWNPAEMIGNAPRRLAFSLYRHLITDNAWRVARARMGYFEPRGLPLMQSCAGQPFIDVRQSFSSYLPADLPSPLAGKIVDHWLRQLGENPHLHDKVEFDIAVTTWSFDYDTRAERLLPADLTERDRALLREAFRKLTVDTIEDRKGGLQEQVAAVRELERRYAKLKERGRHLPSPELVAELLEDAIDYGTIPFSILARHGFIARTLLDSLVSEGILAKEDVERFSLSFPTVAGEFIEDMNRLSKGEITRDDLFSKFGHLRPGTYDILSLRYDQRGDAILGSGQTGAADDTVTETTAFSLTPQQEDTIARRLEKEGFSIGASELLEYCAAAIQGREWSKLVFTRSVSAALEVIAAWGERQGLSREELSHLDIRDILDCRVDRFGRSIEEHLRHLSEAGRAYHEVTSGIRLPYLLVRPSDLVVVPMLREQPNFITLNKVRGPCVLVSGRDADPEALDGHIIAIESADPGFDWIFTRPILGLVTKFGGANSHMAIRCAEFGIPAAIGCGEQIFERVVRSHHIEMDCAVGTIELIGQ